MSIDKIKIKEAINSFLDGKIAKLKVPHKIAIVVIVLALPCAAFYFLSYSPGAKEIKELNTKKAKLEKEIAKVEKASKEIKKHRQAMAETELMFAKASGLLPQQQEIPSLLTSISDLGQSSGLDFLSFAPKKEVRRAFYADIPVDIKVRGAYHNVGVFLDKVSKLSRIVNVSNIDMKAPKQVGDEMILDTTFNLVTYRFVEPEKQDKAPEKGKKKKR